MPAGDAFTPDQRRMIDRARETAGAACGLDFHVYVGPTPDEPRAEAQRLHADLPRAASAVLVLIDPPGRALEIVTGGEARRVLDDSACGLAALTMQAAFTAGDLTGGLVRGLHQLGDHARRPDTLHVESP